MAGRFGSRSSSSPVLMLVVAFLAIVLLLAILYPKKQWDEQARNEMVCRQRMENCYFAARFYHKVTRGYTSDLSEILATAERESLTVHPPGVKIDRLTREDSGIDSFQVDYFDPYQLFSHYQRAIDFDSPAGPDSVVMTIVPLPRYGFAPVTRYSFAADVPITVMNDDRGDQGIFTMVGAQGGLRGTHMLGDPVTVTAAEYIYSIDPEDVGTCPTTGTPFRLWVNVKLAIQAEMMAVLEKEPPEEPLSGSRLLTGIVVYRMLKEADAKARRGLLEHRTPETVEDSLIQAGNQAFLDSTARELRSTGCDILAEAIYDSILELHPLEDEAQRTRWEAIRDSSYEFMNRLREDSCFRVQRDRIVNARKDLLLADNIHGWLEKLHSDRKVSIMETGVINTVADSIDFYSSEPVIKERLFKLREDSVTVTHMSRPEVAELLEQFSFVEKYHVSKVDSVGVTISCPIEGVYHKPSPSFLGRIFTVSGSGNHGYVENGDLSWSERR